MRLAVAVSVLAACRSGKTEPPKRQPVALPGERSAAGGRAATLSGLEPSAAMHLDDDSEPRPLAPPSMAVPGGHAGHPIDITLRSSPPGAQVAVDGRIVGTTPTYANVVADGSEHEFTFVLAHHAVARYRFVPITSGVIHTRLEPVVDEPPTTDDGEDDAPEGDPVPGAGSMLINPPPAPVARPDGPAPGSAGATPGLGPQP